MGTIDGSDLNILQRSTKLCSAEKFPHGEDSHRPTSLMNEKDIENYGWSQHPGGRKQTIKNPGSNVLVKKLLHKQNLLLRRRLKGWFLEARVADRICLPVKPTRMMRRQPGLCRL